MIITHLEGCQFGADINEDGSIRINLYEKDAAHMYHIPFSKKAVLILAEMCWAALTDEERKQVQAKQSGLVIAQPGDIPNGNGHL